MRDGPSSEVLAGAAGWGPKVTSWLNGRVLAEDIPVTSGRLVTVGGAEVPERATFTVPEFADGRSWVPDAADHPLARYGQGVDVSILVASSVNRALVTETRVARLVIDSWEWDDVRGEIRVTALGTLQRCKESRFRVPEVPRAGGTFASEFRRLMVPGVPVRIDPALVDRPIPQSFVWEQDRLAALYEIADAWPARILTDQWGTVQLLRPLPDVPDPVITWTDGRGGTLISAPRTDARAEAYNVVVGVSSATDSPARESVRAVAEETTGPMAVTRDGTGYGEVVRYVSSPLVTTYPQVLSMARKTLADSLRPAVVRSVTAAPDPRPELDDAAAVIRAGVEPEWGWVVGTDLPFTVGDGAMRVDVGVVA